MKIQLYIVSLAVLLGACDGFLDEKPSKTIDTPDTLEALDALLNNSGTMNSYPAIPLMMGGEYFSDDAGITALPPWEQNVHLWKTDPFQVDDMIYDWRNAYNQIQNANVILENLEKIDSDEASKQEIKGAALFYRAHAYYNLSGLFLEGPNLESSGQRFEIPVRRTTAMVLKAEYADLATVKQIIREDLEQAIALLPEQVAFPFRPGKKAAKALKARVYLGWEEYDTALEASGELVEGGLELMDYNDIDTKRTYPFEQFNPEVLWQCRIAGYNFMYSQNAFQANPDLLALYGKNDLRRTLFYVNRPNGYVNFRGSYEGTISLFGGLAADEVYLVYAECLARAAKLSQAAEIMNELLVARHKDGFEPLVFEDATPALKTILEERRKELVFRGLRWSDLRRLNKDERFKTTLRRSYEGVLYELAPDSERYVLPVPARERSFQ
jgi:hypothetical protein